MTDCLVTNDLCKSYRNFKALHRLNMHIPKGAIYGFVGKNGAGKTTLIRQICGLQNPTSGSYSLYGVKNTDPAIRKVRKRMGAVVETPAIYQDMTAAENLDAAFFTFFVMVMGNKTAGAVTGLVAGITLLTLGMAVYSRLAEDEFTYEPKSVYEAMQDVVGENTEESVDFYLNDDTEWVKIPNPRYLSGKLRLVYENLQDLNPVGQRAELSVVVIFLLGLKIFSLKKNMEQVSSEFARLLTEETNGLITVDTRNPELRKLARELNEELKILKEQHRKYQNGDRELKEAVTNISHDLRTPLTAISGYLELLEEEEKSETVAQYLSFISGSPIFSISSQERITRRAI